MNIHEYQAKQLLAQYGVVVPTGDVCSTADEARAIGEQLFAKGEKLGLSKEFITKYFDAVHMESINHQNKIMNE